MLTHKGHAVAHVARWSAEATWSVAPCAYADNLPALHLPSAQGQGVPQHAKKHFPRLRELTACRRCSVCGGKVPHDDMWYFPHTITRGSQGMIMTEAPVHRRCAIRSMGLCPHLRKVALSLPVRLKAKQMRGFYVEHYSPAIVLKNYGLIVDEPVVAGIYRVIAPPNA